MASGRLKGLHLACGQQPRLATLRRPSTRLEDLAGAHADRPNDMLSGCYPKDRRILVLTSVSFQ